MATTTDFPRCCIFCFPRRKNKNVFFFKETHAKSRPLVSRNNTGRIPPRAVVRGDDDGRLCRHGRLQRASDAGRQMTAAAESQ